MADNGKVTITLVKSPIGRLPAHKACLSGLGLRRVHQTISVENTPCNRGMINAVSYMLKVEEV